MVSSKLVNVYTEAPIEGTSVPILSTIIHIRLSVEDIKKCINQIAKVYEVIGRNKVVKLDLNNYDKDNGGSSSGDIPDGIDDYNVTTIQIISEFPSTAYKDILYLKYDSTIGDYIGYMYMPVQYPSDPFHVVVPHVSKQIADGIIDMNPVSGEGVKAYLTKKLNEMKDINVEGKTDKLEEDRHDEILKATVDGNIAASGYKIDTSVDSDDPDNADNKLLVSKQQLKNSFKLGYSD